MPYSFRILPSHRLAIVDLHGIVDGACLIEASAAMVQDSKWQAGFNSLWDARDVRKLLLDTEEANEIASISEKHADRFGAGNVAIVVSRNLDYMMGRMFERTNRNPDRVIRVFWELDQAMAYVGILEIPEEVDDDADAGSRT